MSGRIGWSAATTAGRNKPHHISFLAACLTVGLVAGLFVAKGADDGKSMAVPVREGRSELHSGLPLGLRGWDKLDGVRLAGVLDDSWAVQLVASPVVLVPAPTLAEMDGQAAMGVDSEDEGVLGSRSPAAPNGNSTAHTPLGVIVEGEEVDVTITSAITFYSCYGPNGGYCAHPAGPLPLGDGQAACGAAWPMGTVLLIQGDPLGPVVCNDLGYLGYYQIDRFFWHEEDGWAWQAVVGSRATVVLQ